MFFKICGIKDKSTITCCEKNNVNFYGMIFYEKSPRNISINEAILLINYSQRLKIKPVGVFVNEKMSNIANTITKLNLKFVQLHGDEGENYICNLKKKFKIKIIKKISIKNQADLKNLDRFKSADYYLFDYKPKKGELPGGNAKKFDWSILSNININKPWFLSGGININNINNIKKYVNPHGIDLSSGVEERPGIKNIHMINQLFLKYYEK